EKPPAMPEDIYCLCPLYVHQIKGFNARINAVIKSMALTTLGRGVRHITARKVCTEHDLPPDTIKLPRNVLSILLPTFPITLLSVRLPHCLKGYLRSYH
ncbi:hypothetical protein DUU06_16680, partial [Salmonella enterica subsp. enterica serovar Enteritidis]|nr:hypothetical protein [Salmonella enterica subsp. enterica serovar Enteritidis]EBY3809094.1 hypothetical protein [Salmonella enterica subsp. enterica serovar Adabraka]EHA9180463.1 hypothetical protein [Salmonella enterica subsp. enterica serovar Adabraka]